MARIKTKSPEEIMAGIRKRLGHHLAPEKEEMFFRTGSKRLNAVFGDRDKGIRFGQCTELFGTKSVGKSVLSSVLAARAQKAGAYVILIDAERSYKAPWWKVHGVDTNRLIRIRPVILEIGKKKIPKLLSAEGMFREAEEACMDMRDTPKIIIADSVAAMAPEEQLEKEVDEQNMRTKIAQAVMFSSLLRRWAGLAPATNTFMLLLNQVRTNPAKMFSNPEYAPGGAAIDFYSHSIICARPANGGRILDKTKQQIGCQGILYNTKNKEGVPYHTAGYRIMFDGTREFMTAKEIKSERE